MLDSSPLASWSLDMIAQRFGPGTYRLVCGNGPSARKNSTVQVTPEFAESAGWAAPPPQVEAMNPLQLQARETFQRALQGPVNPIELAAMVQTAVESALEKRKPKDSGLDALMRGFELANTLQTRALEQAKTVLGIAPNAAEPAEMGWPQVVMQVAPALIEGIKALALAPRPQEQKATPATVERPTLPPPQAEATVQQTDFPIPPEETRPIIGLMHQYAGMLRGPLESPATPADLAGQLAGLVGPDLDPSVIATAAFVQANGPGILGNVAPFFATDKAAQVVMEWAKIIQAEP